MTAMAARSLEAKVTIRYRRHSDRRVFIPCLLIAGAAWSCGRGSPALNPGRSAELLASASKVATQTSLDAAALHTSLKGVREGAANVGVFPWNGWRLEPETKVVVTSPGGLRLSFSFTQAEDNFEGFDDIGRKVIEMFKKDPGKKHYDVKIGGHEPRSANAETDLPARLRPSLDDAETRLRALETKLAEVQHLIDRAADLLPPPRER
jgi:hypothetical protein